jgi:hypothetical protein
VAEVAGHLADAHREAAQDNVAELELLQQLLQVRGVGVAVTAVRASGPVRVRSQVCSRLALTAWFKARS